MPLVGPRRATKRPRSALLIALFAFYCLELAASYLTWHEAPIRSDALADPVRAWALCAGVTLVALALRGRWRVVPAVIATVAGAAVPVLLARDLISVVGPRDVWVGQALTLRVVFPLVVGTCAVVAMLTAPPRVAAHRSVPAADGQADRDRS